MGDPETEVVVPRIQSDLLELFIASTTGNLSNYKMQINPESAITVMAVSGGYPEAYENGKTIKGIKKVSDSIVFHAGTKEVDGEIISNGGRVLAVTSFGKDFKEALKKAYANLTKINFDKMNYRRDIGFDFTVLSGIN
ncbi:MAG: phosphoribosylamine--glycine ligase, partial [Xanthomonadaceae bacterium]|nr:phosphoribosylamine--glycine ligase [Xanthomonadaceae bacterium]